MATVLSDIRFERATGLVGAWVQGVPLDGDQPPETIETLHRAIHEHGVLFFDYGRAVSADEFADFGRLFGEVDDDYKLKKVSGGSGPVIDSDMIPPREYRINHWHSDGTALDTPPGYTMLTPAELPPAGGDTMWASMYAAWDYLSPHHQRLLEGVEVRHSTAKLPFLRPANAVHPAVIRDPVTDRRMLFVNENYSERVLGMSERESDTLLAMLYAHINTPEFHVRLRWRPGVIAVWDGFVTQHRGVADFTGPRKLRRITFAGRRPSA